MPELLQRPAEDNTQIEVDQQLEVRGRFLSLSAGQTLEVVDVSEETTDDGEYPERVTLRMAGAQLPSLVEPSEMDYHGSDIRAAVDAGQLAL